MDIKDYLHLYIGCNVDTTVMGNYIHPYGSVDINIVDEDSYENLIRHLKLKEHYQKCGFNDYDWVSVKLILRPLLDITELEYEEINKYGFGGASTKEYWLKQFEQFEERPAFGQGKKNEVKNPVMVKNRVAAGIKLKHYTFAPEAFVFLLSRGFDLFGLIDAGLAIRKEL